MKTLLLFSTIKDSSGNVTASFIIRVAAGLISLMGYLMLIGSPRTKELQESIEKIANNLVGPYFLLLLCIETVIRVGIFIMAVNLVQQTMGHNLYETYYLDDVFTLLAISGFIHILVYYLKYGIFTLRNGTMGLLIYRLGRNICYAVIPALAIIALPIYFEFYDLAGTYPVIFTHTMFFVSYLICILIAIEEAVLASLVAKPSNSVD